MSKEFVATVAVRLTAEDYGVLMSVGRAGEPHAHTFLRVLNEALLDRDVIIRYRKLPKVATWFQCGPLNAIDAAWKYNHLDRAGWEVELAQVPPLKVVPAWPEPRDDVEDDVEDDGPRARALSVDELLARSGGGNG